jgi:hypothetical protein
LDIGDRIFAAKVGDSIELWPKPDSCERPYVMNIQPPIWVDRAMTGFVGRVGFVFALLRMGDLQRCGGKARFAHR